MRARHIGFLLGLMNVGACSPVIQTLNLDPSTANQIGRTLDGVVFYEPALFRVEYKLGHRLDAQGKVVARHDAAQPSERCVAVLQKVEFQVLPDFRKPRALLYSRPAFSAHKFSVSLSNGLLTGVGVEAAPQAPEVLKALIEAAGAKVAVFPPTPATTELCNAVPFIEVISQTTSSDPNE